MSRARVFAACTNPRRGLLPLSALAADYPAPRQGDFCRAPRTLQLGYTAFASTLAEFVELIAASTEKWGKVIAAANIKAE
jgi:hypothetical protein